MTFEGNLRDRNPENRVAGNADDLVKHTTYLAVLRYLLAHEPWRDGLFLHECHAGRGVYVLPPDDPRRAAITARRDTRLGRVHHAALVHAGADPSDHYAGSALLNSWMLAQHHGAHRYEAYEWDPQTRAILRGVVGDDRVLGGTGDERFDGETHIADRLSGWNHRDVVFMDPFAIWDRDRHAERRARYDRIFARLAEHDDPPVWLIYFTWRHALAARTVPTPGAHLEVVWQFGVPCEMRIGLAADHLEPLRVVVLRELAHGGFVEHGECGSDELVRIHVR